GGRLVPADAVHPRKAHRHPGFVAGRAVHRIEGDLEHEVGGDFADRAVAAGGVVADMAVELLQFLVGEAEIGLAHGYELRATLPCSPDPEGVVGIERAASPVATLRVHQEI
ncbi:hypothetical protein RZS08_02190, partial [Arthrospira platensis SPKY1]|nr:hypothetical protein [Arthrospira platensis SPKY1]